ncbi:MAG: hypothetical protein ACRDYB_07370 [Acidimicrobiales bacterium]
MTAINARADDLAATFAMVASTLSAAPTIDELAGLVVSLAVTTITGCDFAGVVVREGGRPVILAASEQLLERWSSPRWMKIKGRASPF